MISTTPAFCATLRGKVLCEDGTSIKGPITIEIVYQDSSVKTFNTDSQGNYAFVLRPGEYAFRIKGKDFQIFVYEDNAPRFLYIQCN